MNHSSLFVTNRPKYFVDKQYFLRSDSISVNKSSPIHKLWNCFDVAGMEEQLPYFQDVGLNALWLSPICKSPMNDMGYDVSNFTAVDPLFGTMADFDSLVQKMKQLGKYIEVEKFDLYM